MIITKLIVSSMITRERKLEKKGKQTLTARIATLRVTRIATLRVRRVAPSRVGRATILRVIRLADLV
jgi:hypothetical protein